MEMVDVIHMSRTVSVIQEMSLGKTLTLPDGYTYGMATDMSIGPILTSMGGENPRILGITEITLSSFHALLNRYDVGAVIPDDSTNNA